MSSLMNDLQRIQSLVSNMRANWGMSGLPTNLQFSADGKKLYFLADPAGTGAEIHYVNVSDEGVYSNMTLLPVDDIHRSLQMAQEVFSIESLNSFRLF
jgi:L-ascorbate metabolism protein UlaG (beta-lactamase superfamily)